MIILSESDKPHDNYAVRGGSRAATTSKMERFVIIKLFQTGSTILCTVTVITVLHQAKGDEKTLQLLQKAINKIL